MAGAEEVAAALEPHRRRRVCRARAERARLRPAPRDRPRRGQLRARRHRELLAAERRRLRRGKPRHGGAGRRAGARGRPAFQRHDLGRLRLPVRGRRRSRPRGRARGAARGRRAGRARPRGHDRRRHADAVPPARRAGGAARQARRRSLPQHAQHRVRERLRGARGRRLDARRLRRRPRRLPVRAEGHRQHRDRGSRLPARGRGDRDRGRPRGADRGLGVAGRAARPAPRRLRLPRGPVQNSGLDEQDDRDDRRARAGTTVASPKTASFEPALPSSTGSSAVSNAARILSCTFC